MSRFILKAAAGALIVTDGTDSEATKAPRRIVEKTIAGALDDWKVCDVIGFAERRAHRNVTPRTHDPRTLKPAKQRDLFAAPL